ncbi:MAG: hypothetical protein J6N72_10620 [Psychrobacter sp.]|nr:hypothetical protein [Psychrobacter sp.]
MRDSRVKILIDISKKSYENMQFSYSGNKLRFDSHLPLYVIEKEQGLHDVVFSVYSYSGQVEKDKKIKFNRVANICEVTLNNCEKRGSAWYWREPNDYKISPSKKLAAVNFIKENGQDLSNSLYEVAGYFGIIPPDVNNELNEELTQMLIDNTDQETAIKVFTEMLRDCHINLIQKAPSNK